MSIDPLLDLKLLGEWVPCMMFADDLTAPFRTKEQLVRIIKYVEGFRVISGVKANPSKWQVLSRRIDLD